MKYRTIWISDIHLGTKGCQADRLLEFLKNNDSETLFLVGDIIDFWGMKRSWYWPASHNTVIQKILRKARSGTRVVYIQGNHDPILETLNAFLDTDVPTFGNISLTRQAIHTTRAGKNLLVLHGDQYDGLIRYAPLLIHLGDRGYDLLLQTNRALQGVFNLIGIRSNWSLSQTVKHSVKSVLNYIEDFESLVARDVHLQGLDGVVCGHIHKAAIRTYSDIDYYNDGDWVESCTALVEHDDGRMEIVSWKENAGQSGGDWPLSEPEERQDEAEEMPEEGILVGSKRQSVHFRQSFRKNLSPGEGGNLFERKPATEIEPLHQRALILKQENDLLQILHPLCHNR